MDRHICKGCIYLYNNICRYSHPVNQVTSPQWRLSVLSISYPGCTLWQTTFRPSLDIIFLLVSLSTFYSPSFESFPQYGIQKSVTTFNVAEMQWQILCQRSKSYLAVVLSHVLCVQVYSGKTVVLKTWRFADKTCWTLIEKVTCHPQPLHLPVWRVHIDEVAYAVIQHLGHLIQVNTIPHTRKLLSFHRELTSLMGI